MEHLEKIQNRIHEVRGVRVMLDFDLAALYQVETRVLKQTVRRNLERFPEDFMFEMTENEYNLLIISLTSQIVISNERGGRRYMPLTPSENLRFQNGIASWGGQRTLRYAFTNAENRL